MALTIDSLKHLLGVDDSDILKACISFFSPVQYSALSSAWSKHPDRFGSAIPTAKEFQQLFEDAGYKCGKCGARGQLTVDHIDGNAKNNDLKNLRILCLPCNRTRGVEDPVVDHQDTLLKTAYEMWSQTGAFPTNKALSEKTGIDNIGGATYKLKWLRYLLESDAKDGDLG